jgi:hypothetical protein
MTPRLATQCLYCRGQVPRGHRFCRPSCRRGFLDSKRKAGVGLFDADDLTKAAEWCDICRTRPAVVDDAGRPARVCLRCRSRHTAELS